MAMKITMALTTTPSTLALTATTTTTATTVTTATVMVDSRQPNTSVVATKADMTQAGVTTQDRRFRLGITSSADGPC